MAEKELWDFFNLMCAQFKIKDTDRFISIDEKYALYKEKMSHDFFIHIYEHSKLVGTFLFKTMDEAFVFANKEVIPLLKSDMRIFDIIDELKNRK